MIENIDKTKIWSFEKMNRSNELVARITKNKSKQQQREKEREKINKIRNRRGDIIADTSEIKKDYKRIF